MICREPRSISTKSSIEPVFFQIVGPSGRGVNVPSRSVVGDLPANVLEAYIGLLNAIFVPLLFFTTI